MREVPLRRFQILEVGNGITQNNGLYCRKKMDGWARSLLSTIASAACFGLHCV